MNLLSSISGMPGRVKRLTLWVGCSFVCNMVFNLMWGLMLDCLTFDHVSSYVFALLWAMVVTLPTVFSRRTWLQLAVMLLQSCLWIANLMYARTYFSAIPLESYLLVGNLQGFEGSVLDSFRWLDMTLLALPVVIALVARRIDSGWGDRRRRFLIAYFAFLLVLGNASTMALVRKGGMAHITGLKRNSSTIHTVVTNYGIYTSLFYDYTQLNAPLTAEQEREVEAWLELQRQYAPLHSAADSTARRSLVVMMCESLESWPIGLTVDGKEVTPNINRLLGDSLRAAYFPNVLTQVGPGRSIDAQLLAFAGIQPPKDRVYSVAYASNTYPSIFKASEHCLPGSRSYMFTSDVPNTWNLKRVAISMGVDSLYSRESWDFGNAAQVNPDGMHLYDDALAAQAVRKMETDGIWPADSARVIVFVTHTGHAPFAIDESLNPWASSELPQTLRDYLGATHIADKAVGVVADYIFGERADSASIALAITGDHEGLATHRRSLHAAAPWVSPLPMVPLILINANTAAEQSSTAGQVDIYSTLIDAMGWEAYPWPGTGSSMLTDGHPGFAFSADGSAVGDTAGSAGRYEHLLKAAEVSDALVKHKF